MAQQRVCEVTNLANDKHSIAIIHRGPSPVGFDALIVKNLKAYRAPDCPLQKREFSRGNRFRQRYSKQ
jgi:hypothetical protein